MRKDGCTDNVRIYEILGYHDNPVLLPDEKGRHVAYAFAFEGAVAVAWADQYVSFYEGARKLVAMIREWHGCPVDGDEEK